MMSRESNDHAFNRGALARQAQNCLTVIRLQAAIMRRRLNAGRLGPADTSARLASIDNTVEHTAALVDRLAVEDLDSK